MRRWLPPQQGALSTWNLPREAKSDSQSHAKLSKTNFTSEETVFKPAAEQFDGSGSYGNGAAMRAHPVGLFGKNQTEVDEIATKQARLTHSNDEGVVGSILQATGMTIYVIRVTYSSK